MSAAPEPWLPDTATEWNGRPVARKVVDARPRCRAVLTGTVRAVEAHHGAALDAWLDDGSGTIVVRWLGREAVPGVTAGRRVRVEGTVGEAHGRLRILNPLYRFEPGAPGG